jgi:hypothetical protein
MVICYLKKIKANFTGCTFKKNNSYIQIFNYMWFSIVNFKVKLFFLIMTHFKTKNNKNTIPHCCALCNTYCFTFS